MDDRSSCLHLYQGKTISLPDSPESRFAEIVSKSSTFLLRKSYPLIHDVAASERAALSFKEPRNLNAWASTYSLDLDFVPFHHLEKEINEIQSSLQLGSAINLEFSCLAPAVRFMSRDFILCAIPFLLRTYKDSKETPKHSRTTAPLLTPFKTFVDLLSSESSTIRSIVNISRWHAHSLLQLEERLSNDRHLRMTCVQEEGIAGWREKKFMLAWEAGLLHAGFLTRWRVVLVK